MSELKRAASVAEYLEKMQYFVSEQGHAYAASFRPRAKDVMVATYAKAGTTWMQQIVHGLRTKGDMNFGEVTDVVPWIELAHDVGWDLNAEQKAEPRAYKTHHPYTSVPKGGKYIWVVRDPKDSAVSFYNFMHDWFLEPGAISLDTFVQEFFLEDYLFGGYWGHLLSWWAEKDGDNVLALSFEGMKDDLPAEVQRVAVFIGCEDDAAIEIAIRQAHFSFMKQHEAQFDDHPIARERNASVGLPAHLRSSKVKTGNVGDSKQTLSESSVKLLDQKWAATVGKALGFENYAALRAAL